MVEERTDLPNEVQMVPVDRIRVLNPRAREPNKFKRIVDSIANVGLKKPITVSIRSDSFIGGDPIYDLVCGQGRLEAFLALGETTIPAIVVQADKEDRLVMSLVENLARRQPAKFEHVLQFVRLREQGYSANEIGQKVSLTGAFVSSVLHLWDNGEERLIRGVEEGRIPLSVATALVQSTDADEQRVLAEAYETGKLTGKKLIKTKRLLEKRRNHGKKLKPIRGKRKPKATADALVRTYQRESQRQQAFVKKARLCEFRLSFVVSAMKELVSDEDFVNLLRAEELATMPKYLAEQAGIKPART